MGPNIVKSAQMNKLKIDIFFWSPFTIFEKSLYQVELLSNRY